MGFCLFVPSIESIFMTFVKQTDKHMFVPSNHTLLSTKAQKNACWYNPRLSICNNLSTQYLL